MTGVRIRSPEVGPLLEAQAEQAAVPAEIRAIVELDADSGGRWTIRLDDGRMSVSKGPPEEPHARILTDPDTLAGIVRGSRSGIQAFLAGDLRVRGNLALAMRMDSMLRPPGGNTRWPTFRSVRAARIHTASLEAGHGPPVVPLHALGATHASMLPTLWDLARDHRVMAPDLPGFG